MRSAHVSDEHSQRMLKGACPDDVLHLLLDALVHIAEVRLIRRMPLVTPWHDQRV